MAYQLIDLKSAAAHLHLSAYELQHCAQRGEVTAVLRGSEIFFERRALDEWAQRRLLAISRKELAKEHQAARQERRQTGGGEFRLSSVLRPETIKAELTAKTRAGVLRDMTDFADSTGLLYDPETLFAELSAREEVSSTAMAGGFALLHPRYHDPYLFQETFLALGRTVRPVFFGAADGIPTDLFFLVCCTDHTLHLHILARLCLLVQSGTLLEDLRTAPDAAAMHALVCRAEDAFLEKQT